MLLSKPVHARRALCGHSRTFLRVPAAGGAARARTLKKQQLVMYPRPTIFEVVSNVDAYQDFLPWCLSSRVLERQPGSSNPAPDVAGAEALEAEVLRTEISVGYRALRSSFASTVTIVPRGNIWRVDAISAPNEYLEDLSFTWNFSEMNARSTRLDLELAFTLRSAEHCLMWDFAQDAIIAEYLTCFQHRCAELSARHSQGAAQTVGRRGP